jgi:hypothetical protein
VVRVEASAYALDLDLSDYFELPAGKTPITAKIPVALKQRLEGIVRFWQAKAIAKGMPKDKVKARINFTYVVERLLLVGADNVWAKAGASIGLNGMPESDADWKRLEEAILADAIEPVKEDAEEPSEDAE